MVKHFLGADHAHNETQRARNAINEMRYDGEKPNYKWEKHVLLLSQHLDTIADHSPECDLAIDESTKISALLNSISSTCSCKELVLGKEIIMSNRRQYENLKADVIPLLNDAVRRSNDESKATRRVASTSSSGSTKRAASGKTGGTGKSGGGTDSRKKSKADDTGLRLVDGKVTGTYTGGTLQEKVWKAMTPAQHEDVKAIRKRNAQGSNRKVSALTVSEVQRVAAEAATAAISQYREMDTDRRTGSERGRSKSEDSKEFLGVCSKK